MPTLVTLFDALAARVMSSAPTVEDARPLSVEDASRATQLFVDFYTHGAPFSRGALAEIWRRCEADPAQRSACRAGRAEADRRLGFLEAVLEPRSAHVNAHAAAPPRRRWLSPPALRAWLLVIVWLAVILVLSSDAFSASSTASLLRPFLHWLLPDWSPAAIRSLHFAIRKTAHVSVYGVLSLLTFRALRLSQDATAARHAGLTLLLVLVVASSDEYRQSRSRARTGALTDVGYDLAGGLAALGLAILWRRPRAPARTHAPHALNPLVR